MHQVDKTVPKIYGPNIEHVKILSKYCYEGRRNRQQSIIIGNITSSLSTINTLFRPKESRKINWT